MALSVLLVVMNIDVPSPLAMATGRRLLPFSEVSKTLGVTCQAVGLLKKVKGWMSAQLSTVNPATEACVLLQKTSQGEISQMGQPTKQGRKDSRRDP